MILCTASGVEEAENISRKLVDSGAAACCNIIPSISSIYIWEGKINRENEVLLIIKTSADSVDEVTQQIKEIHSYELPEIISIPVTGGSDDYIKWVKSITGKLK